MSSRKIALTGLALAALTLTACSKQESSQKEQDLNWSVSRRGNHHDGPVQGHGRGQLQPDDQFNGRALQKQQGRADLYFQLAQVQVE